jgi:hypothetical protein
MFYTRGADRSASILLVSRCTKLGEYTKKASFAKEETPSEAGDRQSPNFVQRDTNDHRQAIV